MSWTEDDPGQGDPVRIEALSRELREVADVAGLARHHLEMLASNMTEELWRGSAADAFRERIGKLPAQLAQLEESYRDAAAGFHRYQAEVEFIAEDAAAYRAQQEQAATEKAAAEQASAEWVPDTDALGQPLIWERNPHEARVEEASAWLRRSTDLLHDLSTDRQAADQRVMGALKQARSAGMRNKSGWVHFWEDLSKSLSRITVVLLVVAVIAVVVLAVVQPELLPGLLLLAGQAMTAVSSAQLAADGICKAGGDDVSWEQLGWDALGALPVIGKAGELVGVSAEVGERLAPALARAGEVIDRGTAAVRGSYVGAKAFTASLAGDAKAVRVAIAITPDGIPMLVRDGKSAGQMLSEAKEEAALTKGRALVGDSYKPDDLIRIADHLRRPGLYHSPENDVMIDNIHQAMVEGCALSEGEENFMRHELTEADLMDGGMSVEDAHALALRTHPLFKNYSPEVIDQLPEYFNNSWRRAWGMEPR
ncbi:MAG TPA: hypothetical protein VK816_10595 [Jatrophihabitantaceae bacterium]|nr:hypothetical protein [Jatrophihabitantaceae bacterium]